MVHTFAKGETVIHTGRPEWGPGDVLSAEGIMHEGKACQRLSIRFSRAGLKTISTAFAQLRAVEQDAAATSHLLHDIHELVDEERKDEIREAMSRQAAEGLLQALPENVTDPFLPLLKRVEAALALYGDWDRPGGLLDWATRQTGLRDALAIFSRHDLESQHERFRIALDAQFRKILRDARKQDAHATEALLTRAGSAARSAVRRADIGR